MTYQNGPNTNRRQSYPMTRHEVSYWGWVVGGILAFVVVLGLFFAFGRNNDANTAANSPATTTGSATPNTPSTTTVPKSAPAQPAAPQTAPAPAR